MAIELDLNDFTFCLKRMLCDVLFLSVTRRGAPPGLSSGVETNLCRALPELRHGHFMAEWGNVR